MGDRLDQALASALYQQVKSPSQVGEAALAVARLSRVCGGGELVTLNYDMQLTQALALLGVAAKPVRSARRGSANETLVRHLHGTLPVKGGSAEEIVLSEAHYYDGAKKRWQETFMAQLLSAPTLFVGTSLNDPNLLRYLYTQKGTSTPSHRAIFTVPEGERVFGGSQRSFIDAVNGRWRAAGVVPLHDDFYGQTTQFLHEVRLRRTLASSYTPYKMRLDAWELAMSHDLHQFEEQGAFSASQRELHERLTEATETIRERIRNLGLPMAEGERLGLELWSRLPKQRSLVRLASSNVVWNDPNAMVKARIIPGATHPAVKAFAAGQGQLIDCSSDNSSPWMSVLALPVNLDDHADFGRLPVGVLMLCSTAPLSESVLDQLRVQAPDTDIYLVGKPGEPGLGQQLLDPSGASVASATP